MGRAPVFFLLFAIQAVILFFLPRVHSITVFSVMFAIIGLCYGGGFGTMPSFTADFFGPNTWAAFMAGFCWHGGLGAVPSPILIARVRQDTGTYPPAIHSIAIVMVVALVLPLLARYRPQPPQEMAAPPEQHLPRAA